MLYIVATPIGNQDDLSKRAFDVIKASELLIGEERKVTTKFMKQHGLTGRPIELLNEHSDDEDVRFLTEECKTKNVALITDCGTPGFCDPGALLVQSCRKAGVKVVPVPGAASITAFLSVCGHRLDQFLFRGFLPANSEKREKAYQELKKEKWPIVIMDTPYRLGKTLDELEKHFKNKRCVLGYRLTFEDEKVIEGKPAEIKKYLLGLKGEFLALILNEVNS